MKSLIRGGSFLSGALSIPFLAGLLTCGGASQAAGDEIRMQNGDTYHGRVLSFNGETLLIQSDVLGTQRIPQGKVLSVTFGAKANPALTPMASTLTNRPTHRPTVLDSNTPSPELAKAFGELNANSNLVQQVQAQLLEQGGPQARDKFNELFTGLTSGKMDLNGLLAEAKSAADQARAARKDLGEDAGAVLDGYLAILDGFIHEADLTGTTARNSQAGGAGPALGLKANQTNPGNAQANAKAEE